ncbi:MAG: nicotinate-nucleotide adenylyltransferase [Gammaproteobacteria bacterium]|jgi:nicotinate-nucleotide adenylyltransferase|nr:nicotinate-nucleotide adenylyltransferase [Gammaproteobacteria bacterium]NCF59168.1 nicotinate-nucleotide adenylyltransferase [Gammaproteobacteria bacterium]
MLPMKPIGILGGTFDPIHYGHLRTAFELLQTLHFEEVRFIPCGSPPHRGVTFAPATLRLDMVRLATRNEPNFVVDDRELRREGPSYSIDTLASLREEFPDRSLCLITGMDAFLGLPTWHRWDEILDFAHIVVAHRPGWRAPDEGALGALLAEYRAEYEKDLREKLQGSIYVHAVTQLEIASTGIRKLVADGYDPRYLMPDSVRNAIIESSCYTNSSQ